MSDNDESMSHNSNNDQEDIDSKHFLINIIFTQFPLTLKKTITMETLPTMNALH